MKRGQLGHNTRPHTQSPPNFLGMGAATGPSDLTTERMFDSQASWVIGVLGLLTLFMLSMGVCTSMQWQTSGRLVQELNAVTVVAWDRLHLDLYLICKYIVNTNSDD